MAWSIIKKGGPGKIPTYREFIVDTENDIATLPIIPALPAGCKAYCSENGNTYVLETDGDWVVKSQGGGTGGASSLAELSDVDIASPEANEILTYDAVEEKWKNNFPEPYPGYDVVLKLDVDTSVSTDTGEVTVIKGNRNMGTQALEGTPINLCVIVMITDGTNNIYHNSSVLYYIQDYSGIEWAIFGSGQTVESGFTFEMTWNINNTFTVAFYGIGG